MGLTLTDKLRVELKKPLGEVVLNPLDAGEYDTIVCVGDKASSTFIESGFKPKIIVYDGKTAREEIGVSDSIKNYRAKKVSIKNEAGRLNAESFEVFNIAFSDDKPTKIFVEGEEDLLALAAIDKAPDEALIVYGQPGAGLVLVETKKEIKRRVRQIIKEMTEYGHRSG
ncbi:MAG: DUF359 domain-containing protein [Candidatus Altiarchaeales archaeon]|nr:DUF359 domain-containing protein [Candidatus Altiarchaeales archaeon]